MKKMILFAAVTGLGLVSAAPPPGGLPGWPRTAQGGYPPCSKTVTDRCIQLYERGVATTANLALNQRPGAAGTMAIGGPYEPLPYEGEAMRGWPAKAAEGDYPPCSRLISDRCIQLHERGMSRGR